MVLLLMFLLIISGLAGLYIKFHKRIPILMYHRIANVPGERNSLSPEKFEEQLDYLKKHGYTTITMNELYQHYMQKIPLPSRPVILTFDDGYEDNYSNALPLLRERDMKATVFPIVNWIGKENKWEEFKHQTTRTMDWAELHKWQAAGMEIGCHTLDHPCLTKCDTNRLEQELMNSKAFLEKNLGAPIDFLCYPYGFFDDKTIAVAKQSGYKGALAIFENTPLWQQELFALPRIPVSNRQPLWEFALKVSRIHVIFILLRKLERSGKCLIRSNRHT